MFFSLLLFSIFLTKAFPGRRRHNFEKPARRHLESAECETTLEQSCTVGDAPVSCSHFWGYGTVYSCGESGSWEPSTTVTTCGSSISYLPAGATSSCSGDLTTGGTPCIASCQKGFEGEDATYVCSETGWAPETSAMDCTEVTCEPFSALSSGIQAGCDLTYGSECSMNCLAGFSGESQTYFCDYDGSWKPVDEEIVCEMIDCGNMLEDVNATCGGNTYWGFGSCEFHCIDSDATASYVCNQQGDWQPVHEELNCAVCPSLVDTIADDLTATCDETEPGSVCEVSCAEGYTGESAFYKCSDEGEWEASNEPQCTANDCGLVIQSLEENAISLCTGDTTYPNGACVGTCQSGYEGGFSIYECAANGTWIPQDEHLLCQRNCGPVILGLDENAMATCQNTMEGDHCVAVCKDGYEAAGTTYTCSSSGYWTSDEPLECFREVISTITEGSSVVVEEIKTNDSEENFTSTIAMFGVLIGMVCCMVGGCAVYYVMTDAKKIIMNRKDKAVEMNDLFTFSEKNGYSQKQKQAAQDIKDDIATTPSTPQYEKPDCIKEEFEPQKPSEIEGGTNLKDSLEAAPGL